MPSPLRHLDRLERIGGGPIEPIERLRHQRGDEKRGRGRDGKRLRRCAKTCKRLARVGAQLSERGLQSGRRLTPFQFALVDAMPRREIAGHENAPTRDIDWEPAKHLRHAVGDAGPFRRGIRVRDA